MIRSAFILCSLFLSAPVAGQLNCSAVNRGDPCAPAMSGSFTPLGEHQRIELRMSGGFPNGHGLLIVGLTPLNIPIPGLPCFLFSDYVYARGFHWRADGASEVFFTWLNEWIGSIYFQAMTLRVVDNGFEIGMTNSVDATCMAR
jgi:hypothetical protein